MQAANDFAESHCFHSRASPKRSGYGKTTQTWQSVLQESEKTCYIKVMIQA